MANISDADKLFVLQKYCLVRLHRTLNIRCDYIVKQGPSPLWHCVPSCMVIYARVSNFILRKCQGGILVDHYTFRDNTMGTEISCSQQNLYWLQLLYLLAAT